MKIQEKDLFHGAAITQIVEHPSFKALNRVGDKYGYYSINHDTRIFIKYRSNPRSPWAFTFQPGELEVIKASLDKTVVFLCLVCGQYTVCALDGDEIKSAVDVDADGSQWVRVESRERGSMRVRGTKGEINHAIAHNSFPDKVFERAE